MSISVTDIEWGVSDGRDKKDPYKILRDKLNRGLLGGSGVTEGVPLRIEIDSERGEKTETFNGYIDLWGATWGNGFVSTPIVARGIDWFNQKADSITFAYLESIGYFNKDNYIAINYAIEKRQNALEIMVLILSIFTISTEIKQQVKEISGLLADGVNPFTSPSAIAKIIAMVVYMALLLTSMALLLVQLYELIIQRVKYHYGMRVLDQFVFGLKYFGYTLKSSLLQNTVYKDLILLPEKYSTAINSGFLASVEGLLSKNPSGQNGYFTGTFGEFVQAFKTMFDAKIIIDGDIFYFENRNFKLGSTGLRINEPYNDKDVFKLNKEDFKSNITLSFAIDSTDRHTISDYTGTSVQVLQLPKAIQNEKNRLTTGYETRSIPFALLKRKTELSQQEKLLRDLFNTSQPTLNLLVESINYVIDAINNYINTLNSVIKIVKTLGIPIELYVPTIDKLQKIDIANKIENRIGMPKMETDYVQVPRLCFLQNGKIVNEEYLNTEYIFKTFHSYKLFVGKDNLPPNQYLLKQANGIPFVYSQFKELQKNNSIFVESGESGEIISCEFNPELQTANIEYKILKQYTNNLELKYLVPNGK
ncbi:MAG: hypothetical protein VKL60_20920 [Sphaerospermopsis sp.]|nr:hypothetical protein [Sphaerospermopsis sp.]